MRSYFIVFLKINKISDNSKCKTINLNGTISSLEPCILIDIYLILSIHLDFIKTKKLTWNHSPLHNFTLLAL